MFSNVSKLQIVLAKRNHIGSVVLIMTRCQRASLGDMYGMAWLGF